MQRGQGLAGPMLDFTEPSGSSIARPRALAITNTPMPDSGAGNSETEEATGVVDPKVQKLMDKEAARLKKMADAKAAREQAKEDP